MSKRLDYPAVKELHDARLLCGQYYNIVSMSSPITKVSDRTYQVDANWYAKVFYSQQETVIGPLTHYLPPGDGISRDIEKYYPEGVHLSINKRPRKDYVYFADKSGVTRYYVIPPEGLRLQRDGSSYKVMNPVLDYRIEIDRVKAKDARKEQEELFDYIRVLWDMIEPPPARINYKPTKLPDIANRESWLEYVQGVKYAMYDRIGLDTLLQNIYRECSEKALAYKVSVVEDTKTDITEHYGKLDQLRAAGMLEKFEGKPKKKRKRKVKVIEATN